MIEFIREMNRRRKWRRRARMAEVRREKLVSFGEKAIGVLVDTDYGLFVVDPEDDFVGRKLLQFGKYSDKELHQCIALASPDASVLMVGAHIGAIAVPLSRHCKKMVAIEANPSTFRFLHANLLLNGCGNVEAFNYAANDSPGKIEFLLSRDNSGGSKRKPCLDDISYSYDKPEVVFVDAYALDEKLGTSEFNMVFMDIEGSEFFALKGMRRILATASTLIVEFIPHHLEKVAGVSVGDFVNLIKPHFRTLFIPSLRQYVSQGEFMEVLQEMYSKGKSDGGLVFSKEPTPEDLKRLLQS